MNRKSEEIKEKQINETMASIENRVRHAYNQGYEQGVKDSKQETCEQIKWERDTAIKQLNELGYGLGEKIKPCEDCKGGYDAGYKDGVESMAGKKAYKKGLEDAWECAKKLMLDVKDGGMSLDDISHIFNHSAYYTLKNVSASEVVEKINEFEKTKDADGLADWHDIPSDEMTEKQLRSAVKDLRKSVIENLPKTGHWIAEKIYPPLSDAQITVYRCSCCDLHFDCVSNYCSNCGSRMEKQSCGR